MRLPLALFASLVLTAPALAAPFDGRWAFDLDICANQRGSGDLIPMTIAGDEILAYESGCKIQNLEPIGSMEQAWKAHLACSGEGETAEFDAIFALSRDSDGAPMTLVEIDMNEGMVMTYHSCDRAAQ